MEPKHKRRVRYKGTHPKKYNEKYKELNPELYPETIEKVIKKAGMSVELFSDNPALFLFYFSYAWNITCLETDFPAYMINNNDYVKLVTLDL